MEFCQRLKELKKQKGCTNAEIGKAAGVSEGGVRYWMNGERVPGADKAILLANYFGVSVAYLLGKVEEPAGQEADGRGDAVIIHRGGRTTRRVLTDEQWKLIEGMFNLQNTGSEREDDEW